MNDTHGRSTRLLQRVLYLTGPQSKSLVWRYSFALALTLLALAVRLILNPTLGNQFPYATFFLGILLTGWHAGAGPALFSLATSTFLASYFFVTPSGRFSTGGIEYQIGTFLFLLIGVTCTFLSESTRRARARAEASARLLELQRENYRVTLDGIADAVVATDELGRVTYLNDTAAGLTGWTSSDAIGQPVDTVLRILREQSGEPEGNLVSSVLRGEAAGPPEAHLVLRSRSGVQRPIDKTAAPIRNRKQQVVGAVVVFRDVAEKRHSEGASQRLAAIVASSEDAIVGKSLTGIIESWNPAAERLYGYSTAEAVGQPVSMLVPEDHADELPEILEKLGRGEAVRHYETQRVRKDGSRIDVSVSISAVRNAAGKLIGASAIARDVSQRKVWEQRRLARMSVNQVLSQSDSVEEASQRVLDVLCKSFDWEFGAYWRLDEDGGVVRAHQVSDNSSASSREFVDLTKSIAFERGIGLPGRVWADSQCHWIHDVTVEPNFPRRAAAQTAGLKSALGCPLQSGGDFWGALEFFARQQREPDADTLEMISTISGQFAQFIQRREAEDRLKRNEQELTDFFDNAAIGMFWADPSGIVQRINLALLELLGLSADEVIGRPAAEFCADPHVVDRMLAQLGAGQPVHGLETQIRRTDGQLRTVLIDANAAWDGDRLVRWRCFALDITQRRKAEEDLRESAERLRLALEAGRMGTWDWNVSTSQMTWSDSAYEGMRRGTLDEFLAEIHLDDRERVQTAISETLREGVGRSMEYRRLQTDSDIRWMEGRGDLIRTEQPKADHLIGVFVDITDRKQSENDLQAAKEAAEAANRAKSEFLANISHELRTPMNAIMGMTELALGEPLPEPARDYLQTAIGSAGVLLNLLNEILDFARLESGKFALEKSSFSLRTVLDETIKTLAVRAHEKEIELALELPVSVPDRLVGDPLRLRQVLMNLVGNAVKFTERGEIVVGVSVESRTTDEVSLTFSVADTGIGISEADQARIFAPFTQADASTTRHYGGTGLGLAISSELISMMGGRIWVESQLNRGSTFYFTARLQIEQGNATQSDETSTTFAAVRGLRVLVVDDSTTNLRILEATLHQWQMDPVLCASGVEAIKALDDSTAAGNPFGLLLLDALMPGMDGFELAARIRARPDTAPTIVMLSSADRAVFSSRCEELGIAVYLEKPISQADLLTAISKALGLQPLATDSAGPDRFALAPASRPLRILLAEDTIANQKLIVAILTRRGHTVDLARNGLEAVELAKLSAYDVVLMDIQMPMMDGFQATRALRSLTGSPRDRLPIVAMTAHAMREDRERCLAAGMDAYIAKPIETRRLIELIESFSDRSVHGAPATGGPPSIVSAVQREDSNGHAFDPAQVLERMGGDEELLRDVMQYFLEDAPDLMAKLKVAIQTDDAAELERAAHSLKGLAANFSAASTVEAAHRLEQIGRSGQLSSAPAAVAELEKSLAKLNEALKGYREGTANG